MSAPFYNESKGRGTTHFLLRLKTLNDRSELGENLVCLLVVLNLSRNKLGKVAQRLGCIKNVLHNTNGLLSLSDELIFGLLNFFLGLRAQLLLLMGLVVLTTTNAESSALGVSLDGVKRETRVLNILAGTGGKSQVSVESSVPASEKAALDLGILGKSGLTNTLAGKRILFQGRRKRVLAGTGVVLVEELAAGQTGAGNSMAKSLWLRLGSGRSNKGGLSLSRRGGGRQKADLFADGAAKVLECLLDVRGIIVGLVGVLRGHSKHLLVGLLKGIDTLLEVDIVGRELGLVLSLAELLLGVLESARRKGGNRGSEVAVS
jgi:hypothetical protein